MPQNQGFVRLNVVQKDVLELVKPFDADVEFFAKVSRGDVGGMRLEKLVPILGELQDAGYLTVVEEDGKPLCMALSSWALCYRREYLLDIVLPALVRGLAGVSGGLVVWLLTKLVS